MRPNRPHARPIFLSSVYECESTAQAEAILAGEREGYVYQREGHPNADMLAETCKQLHKANHASMTSSGMAALSAALLAFARQGDEILLAKQLYGLTHKLFVDEAARLGVTSQLVDCYDLAAVEAAMARKPVMLVVETISNPMLRVADIPRLASVAHENGALLLVDNTFASPTLCRPLELGADLVVESLTKVMNGHSDVVLGAICGGEAFAGATKWDRVRQVVRTWGFTPGAFDCWLAERGLATLSLRGPQAAINAQWVAEFLAAQAGVKNVLYPGLTAHPDHAFARSLFLPVEAPAFGTIVTFTLPGGRSAVDRFLRAAPSIPFCPSLGELHTTVSHPASTSHRGLSAEALAAWGIEQGTLRLSVGIEDVRSTIIALEAGIAGSAAHG